MTVVRNDNIDIQLGKMRSIFRDGFAEKTQIIVSKKRVEKKRKIVLTINETSVIISKLSAKEQRGTKKKVEKTENSS